MKIFKNKLRKKVFRNENTQDVARTLRFLKYKDN